jgi:ubiquinone/menaquinone biosynthesis C-methylase UbiE
LTAYADIKYNITMGSKVENQSIPNNSLNKKNEVAQKNYWNEIHWPIKSFFLEFRPLHHLLIGKVAKIEQGQKILEIGAGYPLYKLYADRVGENGLFVATDFNQNIQRRSQKICSWQKNNNVTHAIADASILPFKDNSFDTIIASNVPVKLECIANEAYRTLKPGGQFIFSFTDYPSHPITSLQADLCKELGFKKVKISPGRAVSIIPGKVRNWYMEASKPTSLKSFKRNEKLS